MLPRSTPAAAVALCAAALLACNPDPTIPPPDDAGRPPPSDAGPSTAHCDNFMRDGDESAVDCGGACPPCADGSSCVVPGDCESGVCQRGFCLVPSCRDGVRNGAEIGRDCGGDCGLCPGGEPCTQPSDCISNQCVMSTCAASSCEDGRQNDDETDVDCGGDDCPPCGGGLACLSGDDCDSMICVGGTCTEPACNDRVQNGDETSLDCGGGTCPPCGDGLACRINADCASMRCHDGGCVACTDMIQNGDESDVDCGGIVCNACEDGLTCVVDADCENNYCADDNTCQSCVDGIRNRDETDVDCGGALCPGCATGLLCLGDIDCASNICDGPTGRCNAPGCGDGMLNGAETDLDCGGGSCLGCDVGETCALGRDCLSGVCGTGGTCEAPTCTDGVANGGETDVDCGGATSCPRCPDYDVCTDPSDCTTGACTMGRCGTTGCVPFPGTSTDAFGYFGCTIPLTPTTLPCPDIASTGTALSLGDDGASSIPIGFSFDYYGTARTTAYVSANGGIFFDGTYLTFSNACFPRTSSPMELIAPYWDDLYPPSGGTVQYQTVGSAPNRQLVVRWNLPHIGSTGSDLGDWSVVLHEGTGHIDMCYRDTTIGGSTYDRGVSATVGINGTSSRSLQFSCNTASLSDGLLIQIRHP